MSKLENKCLIAKYWMLDIRGIGNLAIANLIFNIILAENSHMIKTLPNFLIIFIILVSGCSNPGGRLSCESKEFDIILGKTVPEIKELKSSQITLLFSPFDCSTCLESAFNEMRLIEEQLNSFNPSAVAVLSEPSSIQKRYNYKSYVYFDGEDLIRKSFKFVPTPIFLLCDKSNNVICYHSPSKVDNPDEIVRSMKNQFKQIVP